MDQERRKLIFSGSGMAASALLAAIPSSLRAQVQTLISASDVGYQVDSSGTSRTVFDKLLERVTLEDFGAVGDGLTDDRLAVDKAIQYLSSSGGGRIWLRAKNYFLHDTVFVPAGVSIEFAGEGSRSSFFTTRNHGQQGFRFVRNSGTAGSGSTLTFRDITFQEAGFAKTVGGSAILMWGYDKTYADNYLFCHSCIFMGYDSAVWTRFVGQAKFFDCFYALNNLGHRMDRVASFHWFTNCLSLSNGAWIDADDSRALPSGEFVSDGFSNTLIVEGCISVNSSGNDISINGWQAVYLAKGGCDGGVGLGGSAIHLRNVQDFSIDAMYVSCGSNDSGRAGLFLEDSLRGQIRGSTFVTSDVGILQSGPSPSSIPTIGDTGTKIVIDGNSFRSNKRCDISTLGYLRSSKIVNNHFGSSPSRTGADFEIFVNDANSTCNIVMQNTFSGTQYGIMSGPGSLVSSNIFQAK